MHTTRRGQTLKTSGGTGNVGALMGGTILARYATTCPDCRQPIQPGDEIAPGLRGGHAHVRCPKLARR
jgi:hypothetical protein